MIDIVENGNFIICDDKNNIFPINKWMKEQKWRYLLNLRHKWVHVHLLKEVYTKLHTLKRVKEIWDTLTLMYEDSTKIKHKRPNLNVRPLVNTLQTSKNL